MLNFVELSVLGRSLRVCFVDALHILLVQVEIVDNVGDVGHRLCFDGLRLE